MQGRIGQHNANFWIAGGDGVLDLTGHFALEQQNRLLMARENFGLSGFHKTFALDGCHISGHNGKGFYRTVL